MEKKMELLVFDVDRMRCALPLPNIIRTESAVAITPLPDAPDVVAGVINVRGSVMPVMDVRRRLGLPAQELRLEDHFILAQSTSRKMALWVGRVCGVEQCSMTPQENVSSVIARLPHISGVTAIDGDLIFIHDLEKFLSGEEEERLTRAMETISS